MASLLGGKKLSLPAAVELQLGSREWMEARIDWTSFEPDFDWMAELSRFDFWNPDSPLEANKRLTELDAPDYGPLVRWAKLMMLSARDQGDAETALREIRHLARLIWTNDQIISSAQAIALLRFETLFAEKLGKWSTIPLDDLDRARRYVWALGFGLDPRLSDESWEKLTALGPGQCLVADGNMGVFFLMRSLLGDEFKRNADRLDRLYARNAPDCRPTVLAQIWKSPEYPAWFRPEDDLFALTGPTDAPKGREPANERTMTLAELKKQPGLAKAVVYVLATVASLDPFSRYRDQEKAR